MDYFERLDIIIGFPTGTMSQYFGHIDDDVTFPEFVDEVCTCLEEDPRLEILQTYTHSEIVAILQSYDPHFGL